MLKSREYFSHPCRKPRSCHPSTAPIGIGESSALHKLPVLPNGSSPIVLRNVRIYPPSDPFLASGSPIISKIELVSPLAKHAQTICTRLSCALICGLVYYPLSIFLNGRGRANQTVFLLVCEIPRLVIFLRIFPPLRFSL